MHRQTNPPVDSAATLGIDSIPGPKTSVPFGHLLSLRKDPLAFLKGMGDEYGDLSMFAVGKQKILLVNHPDYVHEILVAQQANFIKSRLLQKARILVGDGLLTSEGAFHMRQRRLVQPAFHHDHLANYAQIMASASQKLQSRWTAGKSINMADEMMKVTLNIVGMTLFSADIDDDAEDIGEALTAGLKTFDFLMLPLSGLLLRLPTPAAKRFKAALKRLDDVVFDLIRKRRESHATKADLLQMLLAASDEEGQTMTDQQIRDEIMTLLLAGHETTANALTWTWHLLSQNPAWEARVHEEVDSVVGQRIPGYEDFPRLRYTNMVFTEALRLYPPFWAIGRISLKPFMLAGRQFPEKTVCILCPYVTQRDARFFPQPEVFDPERWSPENKSARPRMVYFPFGGGGRLCVGERFAWMEAVIVMASIIQKWRLSPAPGHEVKVKPLVTLRSKSGVHLVPALRKASVTQSIPASLLQV